ncbi:D-ribitol-5-phosphate cytidylyltransferase isoform X2 [Rana temporaria]|uniref:D-ribitol-5-phosphate cytidylyltransferase isoform X2 n=1 Tax=Rana temporaria TaxID=8407 RepID=UPI001AAD7C47|nr:D-ribitol-5-phosphate cytidylyltransferase isoform X2 [Rana temporaria]
MAEVRRVSVVLPAGGTGERLGGETPKQYCPVLGRALISWTMEAMERVTWISDIIVVVAAESVDLMKSIIHTYGHKRITLVEGGVTRHRSIFNGLRAFLEDHSLGPALQKPEVVIIHDAVRPFVEEDVLLQVARSAKEHGAAGTVRPLVSTVIASSSDGCLAHSLDRTKHRASEMPQAFLFDVIYKAYLQVTYKRDLYAAESIIKERLGKQLCIITHNKEDAIQIGFLLHETLKSQIKNVKAISSSMCKTSQDLQSILQGQCYNFVCINVKESDFEETQKLTGLLQTPGVCPSYPSVVVSVHLDFSEQSGTQNLSGIRDLAKEAQKADVLVYGLLIRFSKDDVRLQENVQEASAIIVALLKDRNPVLTGQILVAGK